MRKIFFIAIVYSITGFADIQEPLIQFDGSTKYASLDKHKSVDTDGSQGFIFSSEFFLKRLLSEHIGAHFDHRFRGTNNKNMLPEQFYPYEHMLNTGLSFSWFGTISTNISNTVFPHAPQTPMPFYQNGTEVKPEMLNNVEGIWEFEKEWFHLYSTINTFVYDFTLLAADPNISVVDNESLPYGDKQDVDMWADFYAGIDLPLDMQFDIGGFLKDDLTGKDHYNINAYRAGLSGEHQFNRNRLLFSWQAKEQYLTSKMMHENGYANGFITDIDTRLMIRKNARFFIKGAMNVSLAENLFKQYYELQIRKSFNENSSLDIIYNGTNGVLFPRHSLNLHSEINISKHFGIIPAISVFITQLPLEKSFRYYRSDFSLEMFFPLKERIEMYTSCNYTNYDKHPLFASRTIFSAGVRTW